MNYLNNQESIFRFSLFFAPVECMRVCPGCQNEMWKISTFYFIIQRFDLD